MMRRWLVCLAAVLAWLGAPQTGGAWDYAGHRMVNQLALAALPADFSAFVNTPAARERIAFLGGEADRWRNAPDLTFRHLNNPDHFLDLDDLARYQLTPEQLSPFRYDFVAQLALARAAHPDRFPPIDPLKNADHTRNLIGFLPWTITERYAKLKSCFSYLRTFGQFGGTPDEIANAQKNIIYLMGVMGHFVADGAQPLHTTKHYNGWVEPNPRGYTTSRRFHAWIDGGFIERAGIDFAQLRPGIHPARNLAQIHGAAAATNMFPVVMTYLEAQAKMVEPLYRLDKEGKLSVQPVVSPEGRAFLSAQLLKGAQMLADLWLSAWQEAGPDKFLQGQLVRRQKEASRPK